MEPATEPEFIVANKHTSLAAFRTSSGGIALRHATFSGEIEVAEVTIRLNSEQTERLRKWLTGSGDGQALRR